MSIEFWALALAAWADSNAAGRQPSAAGSVNHRDQKRRIGGDLISLCDEDLPDLPWQFRRDIDHYRFDGSEAFSLPFWHR